MLQSPEASDFLDQVVDHHIHIYPYHIPVICEICTSYEPGWSPFRIQLGPWVILGPSVPVVIQFSAAHAAHAAIPEDEWCVDEGICWGTDPWWSMLQVQ
jgi:hypothetical protein